MHDLQSQILQLQEKMKQMESRWKNNKPDESDPLYTEYKLDKHLYRHYKNKVLLLQAQLVFTDDRTR